MYINEQYNMIFLIIINNNFLFLTQYYMTSEDLYYKAQVILTKLRKKESQILERHKKEKL